MTKTIPLLAGAVLILIAAPGRAEVSDPAPIVHFSDAAERDVPVRFRIQTSIDGGPWRSRAAIYPLKGQDVALRVKPVPDATIRWYLVFPDLTRNYSNANNPWEDNAYRWKGFDQIDYYRIELTAARGRFEIRPLAAGNKVWDEVLAALRASERDDHRLRFYRPDAGSFWFQAVLEKGGVVTRSPGLEDVDDRGISRKVLRVSVRDGEGFLGYLSSYFNVPGVFGSVLYQSNNYIGADCADVLMAAWSKYRKRPNKKNYNVQMLVGKLRKVAAFDVKGGAPSEDVSWEEIRPGDFIAVRYEDASRYQHIGALYSDANDNGLFDAEDLVIHAGPDPLHLSKMEWGAFDGHVVILRP